jgi:hypothetical protein
MRLYEADTSTLDESTRRLYSLLNQVMRSLSMRRVSGKRASWMGRGETIKFRIDAAWSCWKDLPARRSWRRMAPLVVSRTTDSLIQFWKMESEKNYTQKTPTTTHRGMLEGESASVDLGLELILLVADAVVDHDRSDEAKAVVV